MARLGRSYPARPIWIQQRPVSTGVTLVSLQASVVGTSSVTADTHDQISLKGTVTGTGTVTAAARVQWALKASVVGTSSVTANLRVQWRLQATVTGTGTVTASLHLQRRIQAAVTGTGTVTANLRVQWRLQGTVTGVGVVLGALHIVGGATALQALLQGTSTVTATMTGSFRSENRFPMARENFGNEQREDRGKTHNAISVAGGGGVINQDLTANGYNRLILLARMTGAATGDLTVAVRPYEDDAVTDTLSNVQGTLFDQALATDSTVAAALSGGVVRLQQTYTVRGINAVQVRVTNANAGAQTATVVYFLQS
jgi:hypothetical protein